MIDTTRSRELVKPSHPAPHRTVCAPLVPITLALPNHRLHKPISGSVTGTESTASLSVPYLSTIRLAVGTWLSPLSSVLKLRITSLRERIEVSAIRLFLRTFAPQNRNIRSKQAR